MPVMLPMAPNYKSQRDICARVRSIALVPMNTSSSQGSAPVLLRSAGVKASGPSGPFSSIVKKVTENLFLINRRRDGFY